MMRSKFSICLAVPLFLVSCGQNSSSQTSSISPPNMNELVECYGGEWRVFTAFNGGVIEANMNFALNPITKELDGSIYYPAETTRISVYASESSKTNLSFIRTIWKLDWNHQFQKWQTTSVTDCKDMRGTWSGVGGNGNWTAIRK